MQPYNFLFNYSIPYMKLPLIDIWLSIVDHSTKKKKKKKKEKRKINLRLCKNNLKIYYYSKNFFYLMFPFIT